MKNIRLNIRFLIFYLLFSVLVFAMLLWFRTKVIENLDQLFFSKAKDEAKEFGRILELKQSRMSSYNFDYSYWDEFVKYVQHPDTGWVMENIVSTMATFETDATLVTDPKHNLIYQKSIFPDFNFQSALKNSFAFDGAVSQPNWFRHFFINSENQIYEVRQAPIQLSNDELRKGNPFGFFYVACKIDSDYLQQLTSLTGNKVSLQLGNQFQDTITRMQTGSYVINLPLSDLNHKIMGSYKISYTNTSVLAFENSFYAFSLWFLIVVLIITAFVSYLIWRWFARPIHLITETLSLKNEKPLQGIRKFDVEFNRIKKLILDFFHQEKELVEAKNKAEVADKSKSNFLAIVSHEMRTPLHSIIGNAGLLMQSNLPPLQQQFNDSIKVNAELLLHVINDILDYAKLESGKYEIVTEEFNLTELIDELMEIFRMECINKNLSLVYFFTEDVPVQIKTDPRRLRQILVNLINNAIKFTNHGGIEIQINLVPHSDHQNRIQFSIKDTGIGIASHELENIFSPFQQSENFINRQKTGTGLGLSICKKLVELLGGQIYVSSELAKGSEFCFTIYAETKPETLVRKFTMTNDMEGRVVLIHPSAALRGNATQLMRLWGLPVVSYSSFQQAKKEQPVSLICVIDEIFIPEIQDNEMLAFWQRTQKPVIMLSSKNHLHYESMIIKSGLNAKVLLTPFKHSDFFSCIQHFIEGDDEETAIINNEPKKNSALKNIQVLVAEDNKVNQELMKHYMNQFQIQPDFVVNGKEAIEKIKLNHYQIVLMDISMPVMDGIETTIQIRKMPLAEQPFIVGISDHAYNEEMENAMKAGMDEYLVKPITFDLFKNKMADWIEKFLWLNKQH